MTTAPHRPTTRPRDSRGAAPLAAGAPGRRRVDRRRAAAAAGTVAAGLCLGVAAFQAALALGVPWGEAAWGGQQAQIGTGLRAASGAAAVVWVGVAATALRQGGRDTWAPVPDRWLRPATLGLTAYTALGVALNLASRSAVERALWTPTTLVLAVSLGLAATWGRRADAA